MFYCYRILLITILLSSNCEVLAQKGSVRYQNAEQNPFGEKSLSKCKQYAKYAIRVEEPPTLALKAKNIKALDCPIDNESPNANVRLAHHKEFPHMAQIGYRYTGNIVYSCSGSLISENFVLTAAHCLKSPSLEPVKVRVGVTNQSDLDDAQIRDVAESFIHPNYTGIEGDRRFNNDIGLLRTNMPFEIKPTVRPACIYTKKDLPYQNGIASLFDQEHASTATQIGNRVLIKETLRFFSFEDCYREYNTGSVSIPISYNDMICAGYDRKNSCKGHSGTPIQVFHNTTEGIKCMFDIVGVAAFGKGCNTENNTPTVYIRVSNYIGWIENIVWKD